MWLACSLWQHNFIYQLKSPFRQHWVSVRATGQCRCAPCSPSRLQLPSSHVPSMCHWPLVMIQVHASNTTQWNYIIAPASFSTTMHSNFWFRFHPRIHKVGIFHSVCWWWLAVPGYSDHWWYHNWERWDVHSDTDLTRPWCGAEREGYHHHYLR